MSLEDVFDDILAGNVSAAQHIVSQLGFTGEYIGSINGSLNVLEVLAATTIFLLANTLGATFQNLQVLTLVSFAYMVHGFHLLCCGLLNESFAETITGFMYYTVFNYVATGFYLFCAVYSYASGTGVVKTVASTAGAVSKSLRIPAISAALSLVCALLHLIHGIYSKNNPPEK